MIRLNQIIFSLIILIVVGCKKENGIKISINYYPEKTIKSIQSIAKSTNTEGIETIKTINIKFYRNGKLKSVVFKTNGILNGPYLRYDSSGKLKNMDNYFNGQLNGKCLWLFESGKIKKIYTYSNGYLAEIMEFDSLSGKPSNYRFWYKDRLTQVLRFDNKGLIKRELSYGDSVNNYYEDYFIRNNRIIKFVKYCNNHMYYSNMN